MKIDFTSQSVRSGLVAQQKEWFGELSTNTAYLLPVESRKCSAMLANEENCLVYSGLYHLNKNFEFDMFDENTIDGKTISTDEPDAEVFKERTFIIANYKGAANDTLYRSYHLNSAKSLEYGFTPDEATRLMSGILPFSLWKTAIADRTMQMIPLFCVPDMKIKVLVNNRVSVGTQNQVIEGQYLTLSRKFDAAGNIELENVYTEAKRGELAFAKVEKLRGYLSEDGKVASAWIKPINPRVIG